MRVCWHPCEHTNLHRCLLSVGPSATKHCRQTFGTMPMNDKGSCSKSCHSRCGLQLETATAPAVNSQGHEYTSPQGHKATGHWKTLGHKNPIQHLRGQDDSFLQRLLGQLEPCNVIKGHRGCLLNNICHNNLPQPLVFLIQGHPSCCCWPRCCCCTCTLMPAAAAAATICGCDSAGMLASKACMLLSICCSCASCWRTCKDIKISLGGGGNRVGGGSQKGHSV